MGRHHNKSVEGIPDHSLFTRFTQKQSSTSDFISDVVHAFYAMYILRQFVQSVYVFSLRDIRHQCHYRGFEEQSDIATASDSIAFG